MEGGGAMEGRGSGLEDWRGEAHLGSSLPMSARRCPCPLVISRVHASWPVSARRCPCLHIVARVCMSFPVFARCCPCLRSGASIFIRGWSVFVRGQQQGVVVGSHWLVVVSPQGWHRRVVAWPLWSRRGARWCVHGCHVVVWLPCRQLRRGTFGWCQ